MAWIRALWIPCAATALAVGCSNTVDIFNDNASGSGGAGGGTTVSTGETSTVGSGSNATVGTSVGGAAQSSVGVGGASVTSTVGAGGAMTSSSVGVGGAGGGGGMCTHPLCLQGPALTSGCDACATQICSADPYCCNQYWDAVCINEVSSICNIDCFPPNTGPCGTQYPNSPVCSDANDECQLAHNTQQSSCATFCAAGGGECLGAFNDVNNVTCQVDQNAPYSCTSQQFMSVVCVCSQGCGTGPACVAPQTCQNGTCI